MRFGNIAAVPVFCLLAACGTVYVSSSVQDVAGSETVNVVDLTPAVVNRANMSAHHPAALPAAFSQVAGAPQPRGAPRLPDPVFDPETRPSFLESRIPPAVDPGPYRIGTGDELILATPRGGTTVEELAGLVAAQNQRQTYRVQDDGSISVPEVGRVSVRGMTVAEAEDVIFQRLVEARMDPEFTLEIAAFNSQRVSVGGAVGSPGVVPITMSPLYLDELIAAAGGLQSSTDDYTVIRIYRGGSLYQVPVQELFSASGVLRVRLIDGDSVFVDTTYDLDRAQAFYEQEIQRAEYTRQARADALSQLQAEVSFYRAALDESRSNFRSRLEFGAEERDYAYIVGEVGSPQRFALPFENTAVLADALMDSGGVVEISGDPSQIYVLRSDPLALHPDRITAYRLDTRNAANYVLATRMELRPGDVIFVAEQPITRWNRTISQILPSITLSDRLAP
jgi:polysaccharide export outer membrane protein